LRGSCQHPLPLSRLVFQRHGLGQRGDGRRVGLRHHRHVDVRAEDQGLAPEAHRALRIQLLGGLKGALRLGMIEAEG